MSVVDIFKDMIAVVEQPGGGAEFDFHFIKQDLAGAGQISGQLVDTLSSDIAAHQPQILIALEDSKAFAEAIVQKLNLPFIVVSENIEDNQLPLEAVALLEKVRAESNQSGPVIAAVYEDLVATGNGTMFMTTLLESMGGKVTHTVCMVEAARGGRDLLDDSGISLTSLVGWRKKTGFIPTLTAENLPADESVHEVMPVKETGHVTQRPDKPTVARKRKRNKSLEND